VLLLFLKIEQNIKEINIMKNTPGKKSVVSLAVGSAFAAALCVAPVASAGENPFVAQPLSKGYMLAHSDDGMKGYGKSGEGRCGMSMADTDKDGRVSADENARHAQTMFEQADTNKDGYIDKDEAAQMRKMHRHHGYKSREQSDYSGGNKSSYVERSGSSYGEYGARWQPQFQHMKPMGQ
jgi:uncharacterized low-complexity protein